MRRSCIVKSRLATHFESNVASNDADAANDFIRIVRSVCDGHVIGKFGDAFFGKEARYQNVGFWQVELAHTYVGKLRLDVKATTVFVVEEGSKYSGGIEVGVAKKINRAMHSDERNRVHVADDTIIFDGLKAHRPSSGGKGGQQ